MVHGNSRLLLSLLVGLFSVSWSPTALGETRPNVILCMADDLGWGDTGYNGNTIVRTPHLDAMAKSGVTFNRWYAGAPVCSPTRGNCLTGRHPFRLGIPTANKGKLLPKEMTLAEQLKAKGYVTGHFGKWHLGTVTTEMRDSNRGKPGDKSNFSPPWQNGFDVCFSTEAKVPTYDPMKKPKNVKDLRYGWQPVSDEESEPYGTHYFDHTGKLVTDNLAGDDSRVIMDRAIPFVREAVQFEKPFFIVVWFHAPHLPVVAGPKHSAMYADLDWREQMYYGCITALDEQVGRLRAELESLGVADETMMWFSSDNGPENKTPGSAGDLRARKRSLYEGGVRVPGLLTWPDRIRSPKAIDAPCHTGDYYPTVLTALGESFDDQVLDGIDLLPIIMGDRKERGSPIHFRYGTQATSVGDKFKLYRTKRNAWELYDLSTDVAEEHNIATEHTEVVQRLSAAYEQWSAGLGE